MSFNWSSAVCRTGPSWPGLTNLKNFVVFGASYCDVGFVANRSPWPTPSQPLGVAFPGTTWAENSAANWVGHICDAFRREGHQPPRVYDLAHGGQQVDGVAMQIRKEFFGDLGRRWEAGGGAQEGFWRGDDTLFAIWVGINDCALIGVDGVARALEMYFRLVKELYESGARNFMLVDLPPLRRIPAARGRMTADKQAYEEWNDILHTKAAEFAAAHDDVTMVVYSSWRTFTRVLDEHLQYGFTLEDTQRGGSEIWADELHPTSKVHEIVAQDMLALLRTVPVHSTAG